jgi:hypothetical protein
MLETPDMIEATEERPKRLEMEFCKSRRKERTKEGEKENEHRMIRVLTAGTKRL